MSLVSLANTHPDWDLSKLTGNTSWGRIKIADAGSEEEKQKYIKIVEARFKETINENAQYKEIGLQLIEHLKSCQVGCKYSGLPLWPKHLLLQNNSVENNACGQNQFQRFFQPTLKICQQVKD